MADPTPSHEPDPHGPFSESVPAYVVGVKPGVRPVRAEIVADARSTLGRRLATVGIGGLILALAVLGYQTLAETLAQSRANALAATETRTAITVLSAEIEAGRRQSDYLLGIIRAQQAALEEAGIVAPGQVLLPGGKAAPLAEQSAAPPPGPTAVPEPAPAGVGGAGTDEPPPPAPAPAPASVPAPVPAPPGAPAPAPAPPVVDVPIVELPPVVPGVTGPGGIVGLAPYHSPEWSTP